MASYRSGLEEKAAQQIAQAGLAVHFEKLRVKFTQPAKDRTYTPDFILAGNGIIIETKGLFQTEDRQKHILIKEQHPDLDIRFVFSNAQAKVAKKSKTTYAAWAEKHGFKWSHRVIPPEWLMEPENQLSLNCLRSMGFHSNDK